MIKSCNLKFLLNVINICGKNDEQRQNYVQEVIKADLEEAGDEDVFRKVKKDFENSAINIDDSEIRNQMSLALERAKEDFK